MGCRVDSTAAVQCSLWPCYECHWIITVRVHTGVVMHFYTILFQLNLIGSVFQSDLVV